MIKTKRIYEPADPSDGHRLLIMRRWPRGIKKTTVDSWEPDLGPSLPLLTDYRQGKIDWPALTQHYRREMAGRGRRSAGLPAPGCWPKQRPWRRRATSRCSAVAQTRRSATARC